MASPPRRAIIGNLHVQVHSGSSLYHDIPDADTTVPPWLVLSFNDVLERTRPATASSWSYDWQCKVSFPVSSMGNTLVATCFGATRRSEETALGRVSIPLSRLPAKDPVKQYYPLCNMAGEPLPGAVCLTLLFMPAAPGGSFTVPPAQVSPNSRPSAAEMGVVPSRRTSGVSTISGDALSVSGSALGSPPSRSPPVVSPESATRRFLSCRLVDYYAVVGLTTSVANAKAKEAQLAHTAGLVPPAEDPFAGLGLLVRYPVEDHPDLPFPMKLEWFCFPDGGAVCVTPAGTPLPEPEFVPFVLATKQPVPDTKLYGVCLHVHEPLPRACTPAVTVTVPRAIVLLTRTPFVRELQVLLRNVFAVVAGGLSTGGPECGGGLHLGDVVRQLVQEVPLPVPGVMDVRVSVGGGVPVAQFGLAPATTFPSRAFGFEVLFRQLPPAAVLRLFAAMLCERKILLHSAHPKLLSVVAETLCNLMYPFKWACLYIPVLPLAIAVECIEAPVPFMYGVMAKHLPTIQSSATAADLRDLVGVDIDNGVVSIGMRVEDASAAPVPIPELPRQVVAALMPAVREMHAAVLPTKPGRTTTPSARRRKSKVGRRPAAAVQSFTPEELATRAQVVFTAALALLLDGYRDCLFFPRAGHPGASASGMPVFSVERFVVGQDEASLPFFQRFFQSQLFVEFLHAHSSPSMALFHAVCTMVPRLRDDVAPLPLARAWRPPGATPDPAVLDIEPRDQSSVCEPSMEAALKLPPAATLSLQGFFNLSFSTTEDPRRWSMEAVGKALALPDHGVLREQPMFLIAAEPHLGKHTVEITPKSPTALRVPAPSPGDRYTPSSAFDDDQRAVTQTFLENLFIGLEVDYGVEAQVRENMVHGAARCIVVQTLQAQVLLASGQELHPEVSTKVCSLVPALGLGCGLPDREKLSRRYLAAASFDSLVRVCVAVATESAARRDFTLAAALLQVSPFVYRDPFMPTWRPDGKPSHRARAMDMLSTPTLTPRHRKAPPEPRPLKPFPRGETDRSLPLYLAGPVAFWELFFVRALSVRMNGVAPAMVRPPLRRSSHSTRDPAVVESENKAANKNVFDVMSELLAPMCSVGMPPAAIKMFVTRLCARHHMPKDEEDLLHQLTLNVVTAEGLSATLISSPPKLSEPSAVSIATTDQLVEQHTPITTSLQLTSPKFRRRARSAAASPRRRTEAVVHPPTPGKKSVLSLAAHIQSVSAPSSPAGRVRRLTPRGPSLVLTPPVTPQRGSPARTRSVSRRRQSTWSRNFAPLPSSSPAAPSSGGSVGGSSAGRPLAGAGASGDGAVSDAGSSVASPLKSPPAQPALADSTTWRNLDELLLSTRGDATRQGCPSLRSIVLAGHGHPVLCTDAKEGKLVSGDAGGCVYAWETTRKCRSTHAIKTFKGDITAVRLLDGGFVCASADGTLRVARFPSKPRGSLKTQRLKRHKAEVLCVDAWQGTGTSSKTTPLTVLSGSADELAIVWNGRTGKVLHTFGHHSAAVLCAQLTPDGSHGVTGSEDHTAGYLDVQKGSVVATFDGHTNAVVCCHTTSDRVVTGSTDGLIKVWDTRTRRCAMTLSGHVSAVWCLSMPSADDNVIISGGGDGQVKLWDLRASFRGSRLTLHGHTEACTALDLDWSKVVTASSDMTVRLWDVNTGRPLSVCAGHTGSVTAVKLLDTYVASSSMDGTLRCWFE